MVAVNHLHISWTVATSSNTSVCIEQQTRLTLDTIEQNLIELGSDKTKIVSAQVYIANMADKQKWIQHGKSELVTIKNIGPQRACLGVNLEGDVLIEVTVTAVRKI